MKDEEIRSVSASVLTLLRERGEKLSFAESLTGGLIAASFVENAGASAVLEESYVTYAAQSKMRILGVARETVEQQGVVSARCALEMAQGVRRISGADWGVSATGLAGPDGGTAQTPVGTVFIGVAGKTGTRAFECHFPGDRDAVRRSSVARAFELLQAEIEKAEKGEAGDRRS